jgi:hypothetical protein
MINVPDPAEFKEPCSSVDRIQIGQSDAPEWGEEMKTLIAEDSQILRILIETI